MNHHLTSSQKRNKSISGGSEEFSRMPEGEIYARRQHPARPDRLLGAFIASVIVLATAGGVTLFAPWLAWPLINLAVLGIPAAAAVVAMREAIRLALARVFGFDLFGIQWGAGPRPFRFRWGKAHHRVGFIPLGADTRFASCRPGHHRFSRWVMCLSPALVQLCIAFVGLWTGALTIMTLSNGLAPFAMFHLANIMLLSIHVLVPFETPTGLISDLRLATVLALCGPDEDRSARATALMLGVEFSLESGDIETARHELHSAIVQVGREPMLIHLEDRLERIENTPDPAHAAKSDAITDPFEHPWAIWDRDNAPLSFPGRLLRIALRAAPITIFTTFFVVHEYDALIHSAHAHWVDEAQVMALGQDADACELHLGTFEQRLTRLTLLSSIPRRLQVSELRARATLNACAGNFERAVRDQSLAVEIADSHRRLESGEAPTGSIRRVEAELVLSSELRQLAAWQAARGTFREALRATQRAEEELGTAHHQISTSPESSQRSWALQTLSRERLEVEQTRLQILSAMNVRG